MFAVLVVALVVPVMLAARMVGAERTGFGSALIAVILQMVLSAVVRSIASDQLIVVLVALIVGSGIYSFTLGTTLLKGFLVSIIATVIAVVAIVLLASSFAVIASAA
ncbi:hypothetical protein [Pseudoxanthomonas koreensis]|uniref:hypothetical protein n=1 Tax=Pseudoxanthomonas koreensis TaxID=266061 RepID=UPI0035A72D62